MGRKHRTYANSDQREEHETIDKLKAANKRLKKQVEELKQELATYEKAFNKTSRFLKDNTEGFSVHDVIQGAKHGKTLEEMRSDYKQVNAVEKCNQCSKYSVRKLAGGHGFNLLICDNCKHVEKKVDNS